MMSSINRNFGTGSVNGSVKSMASNIGAVFCVNDIAKICKIYATESVGG